MLLLYAFGAFVAIMAAWEIYRRVQVRTRVRMQREGRYILMPHQKLVRLFRWKGSNRRDL